MRESGLPLGKQIVYAFGMMGWSIMINLISVILIYLYLPPANSGLPALITQVTVLGTLNAMFFITSSGRLVDAFYDPFIAQASDKSRNPRGRRTPLMKRAILPSLLFCCLVFYPLREYESAVNIYWLMFTLVGFYVATTTYIIPYYALLPEMAATGNDKVRLASWQSAGYIIGIGVASNAFNITDLLQHHYGVASKIRALQYTVCLLAVLATICLAVTAYGINEQQYMKVLQPHSVPLKQALRQTLGNRNFRLFIVADFSYFIAITIIISGLMFFVTVLLQLPETIGNKLVATMAIVSFLFYPVINFSARKIGKKRIIVFSFFLLALIFSGVYFLGRMPMDKELQIYLLVSVAALPFASLNILPNAMLAEIIAEDNRSTGENKEAVYFAVRYFFVKIAQTFGIAVFAMLLIYGKDVNNDLGIRLNGILGLVLCLLAAIVFTRFKENRSEEKGS